MHSPANNMKTSRIQLVALFFLWLSGSALLFSGTNAPAGQAPVPPATGEKIIRYVRERFNIPDSVKLSVSSFRDSAFPDFYQTSLTLDDGKQPRSQDFFVSKDGRYLIEGNIYTLGGDPRREIINAISLKDQPTQGPASAPVTIVEYADLECPMCARLHEVLENDVVPKYGNKLRVVFKDFPLAAIHDWAVTGAIASQCVYQIAPENFVAFRTLAFQNQTSLNADNARDVLLHLSAQAGIDSVKLASCVDAKTSLPRVEANLREGQALGIAATPTSFINGKVVVSAPELAALSKMIDEALQAAK